MKISYLIAWLTIAAFLGWSGNLLIRIQTYWAETSVLHDHQEELGQLSIALQDLSRPGNDVLENYEVQLNRTALERYSHQYQTAFEEVNDWVRNDPQLGPLIASLERERSSISGFASEILELAGQRELLSAAGASEDAIREKETQAAANMARMDQAFQTGLQILLEGQSILVDKEQHVESLQRRNFKELYIMLFVALVASGLSVELIRRTIRQREALRESSDRINAIMNNVIDGIITVDEQGRIESANPAAESMFGYGTNALIGLQFTNLLDESCRHRYQEQLTASAGKVAAPFTLGDCEHPGQRKDGSCFPLELALNPVTVQGRPLLIHIVRDITARRRAESNIRQAASVFDNINEGIMITDISGKIQSVNPAFTRITQYKKEEVIGKNPRMLQSGNHDREFYREMWSTILEYGQWQGEILNRRKNGELFPQWLTINALKDERGKTTNYLGVTWDISELKASERMKEEFITNVSHELRTPLTSVLGSLGMLIQGDGGPIPEQASKLLRMAYSNSGRVVRLVGDIMDFEKMSGGKMNFRLKTQNLMPLVQQTIDGISALSNQYGTSIELVESIPDVRVTCDAERLMQAITNLLSNAIKYSPPGDRIEVSVSRQQQMIRIAVTDHGPGIPEDFHSEIFKKFSQLDNSSQPHQSGIGLGLSIAKVIVEKHNGTINLESKPGVRTSFFIELPDARKTIGSAVQVLQKVPVTSRAVS